MFGRRGRRRDPAAVADDIRRTIARLDDQRRLAARTAGRALVGQAEVQRACAQQLEALRAAFAEAEDAQTLALRAARTARRDGDAAVEDYERTAAGLASVQDALGLATQPIHDLLAAARGNTERAREVLVRARAVLDDQLREQVRLLVAFERAERQRVLLAMQRDEHGDR
ncbi:hypothetical protein SAMN05443575_2750 [Jatrophihabitans endophyticus]|uniref:Uncharacterized protein n=1 Tax=Jatrophihabitans endophyticus TaxID=1206085 RepID=A0A1M5MLU2_9ACTN|nr:hypothetical protein [Jatrophihabitans endophyticus]SHG77733.1 hypothetical protein SAMN05443575_2750 [Jatrophihabitans endophyticus]